ncbi:glucans biosynthesis glucosyltransferase MdoH [Salipiger bermudensis]|uniref:glucans biosynthesis glucosyltransferase MdoH n=1 Tax=Salipiger bermudensis TaxID=344736 RepID=UPI001CD69049|nr:glucans biosynthesis glucosyltransferase MdoH [Salipiger bermudensis]MCA0962410.1 glucans biosynthesis glucosyltransferase MdoH [Salipiger bermudensis]
MKRAAPAPDGRTVRVRALAVSCALLLASFAAALIAEAGATNGFDLLDGLRTLLIFVTTGWLAWGAMLALTGLPHARPRKRAQIVGQQPPTVVLVPICNEDAVATFTRIQAMHASAIEAGLTLDIAVLSDTQNPDAAAEEVAAFDRLLSDQSGGGRIFYRRRTDNSGRKAGNIEDFIRRSGGAYEFAVILDADSLMEGDTLRAMIAEMQADPKLGLFQTLPRIVGGHSLFGRAMQFAAAFHGPIFTRGLERMQGSTGPFWGHNAIVRVRAFAESCALPELSGKPPFGGHILSHDYVEAALLARAGWSVRVDHSLGGSFEEGPENVLSYAKRDRRWCQGNLQHIRLLTAPGLAPWSRFVFFQGILSYIVSVLWASFLLVSIAATVLAPAPDYFPDPNQLFPVFPSDRTKEITALAIGIVGLLILPKLAILIDAAATGRVRGFGGTLKALASLVFEILLSSLMAPVMMMYQLRAVIQVFMGRDGGWPANARGEGLLHLGESFKASAWIVATGIVGLAAVYMLSVDLVPWILPVCVPMILAPLLIAMTSRPLTHSLFRVPDEAKPAPVVARYRALMRQNAPAPHSPDTPPAGVPADVAA